MKVKEKFTHDFIFGLTIQDWVTKAIQSIGGKVLVNNFAHKFSVTDYNEGMKGVKALYEELKEKHLNDYKELTELAVQLAYLAYANEQLSSQGYEGRERYTKLYWSLYEKLRRLFYRQYKKDRVAQDHFFEWTD